MDKKPDHLASRLDSESPDWDRGNKSERKGRKLRCWWDFQKDAGWTRKGAGAAEKEVWKGRQETTSARIECPGAALSWAYFPKKGQESSQYQCFHALQSAGTVYVWAAESGEG
jgi:hypothetical protein